MTDIQSSANHWLKVSQKALLIAVFLVPVFFLPFTSNVLDLNKQVILVLLTLGAFLFWLLKALLEEKISLNVSRFNLLPLILVVALGISTLISAYPYASFWGWPLAAGASFLVSLALVLFYFILTHVFSEAKDFLGIAHIAIISGLLVALIALPHILGKFFLPFDFAKVNSFNTIGTINSLAVFLAVLLPLASSLVFSPVKKILKILGWSFILLSLFLLLVINFKVAWIALLAGSALILIFGITRRESFSMGKLALPMILLAISFLSLVLTTSLLPIANLPAEVSPSFNATAKIAFATIQNFQPPWSFLFGSGPGTFVYDYSLYKPLAVNQTSFWATRFVSGASDIIDKLATTGILGLVSFLAVIFIAGFYGFKALTTGIIARKEDFSLALLTGVFASFVASVVGQIFYGGNLTLAFIFWLLLALLFGVIGVNTRTFEFHRPVTVTGGEEGKKMSKAVLLPIGVSAAFIVVLIATLMIFFFQGQHYLAEVKYMGALKAVAAGDNVKAINILASAIGLTERKQDNLWRDLSQVYIYQINQEAQNTTLSKEELSKRINDLISQVIASAKAATDVSPKSVANWTIRGAVYASLFPTITGVDDWAIQSYETAFKLEPTNPSLPTEIGQLFIARADNTKEEAKKIEFLAAAKEKFQQALELKSDYAPARYQLAMIDIRENKTKDAIVKLEETKTIAPFDVGLSFQLGLVYYSDNQMDKAQVEFERTVSLNQNYSNARYFLGLIYDKAGKKALALEQFEAIAKLNPDNAEVPKIVANLKAGKPALQGVQVESEPPIQEETGE